MIEKDWLQREKGTEELEFFNLKTSMVTRQLNGGKELKSGDQMSLDCFKYWMTTEWTNLY